jgi:hypothetical protein
MTQEELNDLSKVILDASIAVHKEMGQVYWRPCISNALLEN